MEQQNLFSDPPEEPEAPYQRHSSTSKAAARDIDESASTLRAKVYAHLRGERFAGATDEEIQSALQMNPSTECPRRIELVEAGLVKDSGGRRPTRSGRSAVVWVAVAPVQRG